MKEFNWINYISTERLGYASNSVAHLKESFISLTDLVERKIELYADEARYKSIHLGLESTLPHTSILGNEAEIEEIVDVLIRNALNQTLEGFVKLDLVEDDKHYGLTVTDSGLGIDPDQNIFYAQKDFKGRPCRVMHITDPKSKLSAVKELILRNQGTLELCIEAGEGTARRLWLPKISNRAFEPTSKAKAIDYL